MRISFVIAVSSALIGLLATSGPLLAQQKTVKACQDEWRANRAANQGAGITEKAFVEQCRAGGATAQPAARPAGPAVAAPAQKPATPAQPPTTTGLAPATSSAPAAPTSITGANQFASESLARGHCLNDTVVWANLNSKIYHFGGARDYGNTKEGAYMCERDARGQGMRAAKNEKHP